MTKLYEKFKHYFKTWSEGVKVAPKTHPYARFSREGDRIYDGHIKSTQKYMDKQN